MSRHEHKATPGAACNYSNLANSGGTSLPCGTYQLIPQWGSQHSYPNLQTGDGCSGYVSLKNAYGASGHQPKFVKRMCGQ
jgi:hypothetical protein